MIKFCKQKNFKDIINFYLNIKEIQFFTLFNISKSKKNNKKKNMNLSILIFLIVIFSIFISKLLSNNL